MHVLLALGLLWWASVSLGATLSEEILSVDGVPRRYLLHDYSAGTPTALVILLHGGGGGGQNMAEQTGFEGVAAREGLIAVYPFGSNALFNNILLTWNAGHCCAYALERKVDDIRFLSLLIDHLVASGKVDPARVYVTGLSNGGMMAHRAGIELADKVTAIAPVISSVFGDEPLVDQAMPTLIINGAVDDRVKAEGGPLTGFAFSSAPADLPTKPITAQGEYWAAVNNCGGFTDNSEALYLRRVWQNCRSGGAVESYVVKGNGHAWPGGTAARGDADRPVTGVDANEVIWAFFQRFRSGPSRARPEAAYYYVGQLHVPALSAGEGAYRARLDLVGTQPVEFALQRLTTLPAGTVTGSSSFANDLLQLERVAVGWNRYRATLKLTSTEPLRLQLLDLR